MLLPGKPVPDEDTDGSDEERLPAIQPDDITVAIFCALAHESVTVKYTLDEEFACVPKTIGRQNYVHWFGRIATHNIVIARPVQMGPVNAAQCAATVSQQFPNLRLALMDGIGAGIPSDKLDMQSIKPGLLQWMYTRSEPKSSFGLNFVGNPWKCMEGDASAPLSPFPRLLR